MIQIEARKENEKQVNLYGISTLSELAEALKIPVDNLTEESQKDLDDSEVEAIRDLMYQLAFVVVEDYQNKCSKVVPITAERNTNEK